MFDWDDLRIFLALARLQKLASAAAMLEVDATTVTRRLARLEQKLGVRLFEVIAGERVLTGRGQDLLQHAEIMESAALSAAEDVAGHERHLSGQVRLSVAEGFGTWVLAPGMADFNRRHPGIRLDLVTASGFLNPSKREADMAVMLARPQKGRLVVRRLGDYRLHLYAAPAYLERASCPQDKAALHSHSLIGYVPEFIFTPELHYLDEVDAGLEANLRSTSIIMQHRMICEGAGIGVLPDFIGQRDPSIVPILAAEVEIVRSFWLVIHSDLRKTARVAAVADWLRERVAGMSA